MSYALGLFRHVFKPSLMRQAHEYLKPFGMKCRTSAWGRGERPRKKQAADSRHLGSFPLLMESRWQRRSPREKLKRLIFLIKY
jgi:hypothetical protein